MLIVDNYIIHKSRETMVWGKCSGIGRNYLANSINRKEHKRGKHV